MKATWKWKWGRKFNKIEIEHEIMIGLLGLLADESKMVVPGKSDMEAIYIYIFSINFTVKTLNKLGESLISDKQSLISNSY